jgi:hypothetical protein
MILAILSAVLLIAGGIVLYHWLEMRKNSKEIWDWRRNEQRKREEHFDAIVSGDPKD